jgi:hypothetical protein
VLVSNNHRDLVPIVDRFARDGEEHYGVLLTSDRSMPRATATIELSVRSIVAYAADVADDDLLNSYDWLAPTT